MPDKAEFEAAIAQITSYAEEFDVEVRDEIKQDYEEDLEVTHIVLQEDNQTLYVSALEGRQYFILNYPFNLTSFIANGLSDEDVTEILEDSGFEENPSEEAGSSDSDKNIKAAQILLSECDSQSLRTLRHQIGLITTNSTVSIDFHESEDIPFTGYSLLVYVFPFESDFSLRRFADRLQDLLNAGFRGSESVQFSTRLATPEDEDSENYQVEIEPGF